MISSLTYINKNIREHEIGIIVSFDSLDGITVEPGGAYAELNLYQEDTTGIVWCKALNAGSITLNNGDVYTPGENELLFKYNYQSDTDHLGPTDFQHESLIINRIVIDDMPEITLDMEPLEGYRVYLDLKMPFLRSAEIVENESNNVYYCNDTIKVEICFNEPVYIIGEDMADACKFNFWNPHNDFFSTTEAFTSCSVNGTVVDAVSGSEVITVFYKITDLRGIYEDDVRLLVDRFKIRDEAGNELGDYAPLSPDGYFIIDNNDNPVKVNSVYPLTEPDKCYFAYNPVIKDYSIKIMFDDDNFSDATGQAGIFLSEDKIEDIENIAYEIYPLLGNVEYDNIDKLYKLMVYTNDDAFDKANNTDQEWYFYYTLQDGYGNKEFFEVEQINTLYGLQKIYIDRKAPDIILSGDYLVPEQNHLVRFEINDRKIYSAYITINDMNGNELHDGSIIFGDLGDFNTDNYHEKMSGFGVDSSYLNLTEANRNKFNAEIDLVKLYETIRGNLFDTETYELVIQAQDSGTSNGPVEKSTLFTMDKSVPTVTVNTIDSEDRPGRIKAYSLEFWDTNGQEALDQLLQVEKKVTMYYDFAETGLSEYNEAEDNEQIINLNTDQPVEVRIPYEQLSPGEYCLNIRGIDTAGNEVIKQSSDTFTVEDKAYGTIACDEFTHSTLTVDFNLENSNPYMEYRVYLDDDSPASWLPLIHTDGIGSLYIDLNEPLPEGQHNLNFQYRYEIDDIFYESQVISKTFIFDITGPEAIISYSTQAPTYGPVTAILTGWADNYSDVADISLISDYTEVNLASPEDTYTFVLADEAGNTSAFTARADWILTDAKPATVVYSTTLKTHEDVSVYLDFEAMDNDKALVTLQMDDVDPTSVTETLSDEGYQVFTFSQNSKYIFEYQDDLGKTGYVTAYIHNIDRTSPTGEISYNTTSLTSKNVYGYVKPSEAVHYQIYDAIDQLLESKQMKPGGIIQYEFTQNGSVTVLLEDEAGNQQIYELSVDWMDKIPPSVNVEYSDNYYEMMTKDEVTVTITADEPIHILNNHQENSRIFKENGSFTFFVEDIAGNRVEVNVSITNIATDPALTLTYSTLGATNQDVIVSLTADAPITILNNDGSNHMLFTENGKKYFKVEDEAGGIFYQTAEVTWIDKKAPEMVCEDSGFLYTTVGGSIDLTFGFGITDNMDGIIENYTVSDNINLQAVGVYYAEYTFSDRAGNVASLRRTIEVLPEDRLVLTVNGIKTSDEVLILHQTDLKIRIYNTCGSYELQYREGLLKTGSFKKNKQLVKDGNLTVERPGYITLYVQDQERNWKQVYCYVYK